jgi:ABC-type cobalamin/Fe3+-siderophores transport system ATPase subunit
MELIDGLQKKGITIIMVLHDLNLALRHSHICGVMHNGSLSAYASPEDIYFLVLFNSFIDVITMTG